MKIRAVMLLLISLSGILTPSIETSHDYVHVQIAEENILSENTVVADKKIESEIEDYTKYLVEIDTSNIKETYLSKEIQNYCIEIGNMYNICPEFIMAIIEAESSGNQYAVNGGCKGLMQIYEKYHKDRMERLGVTDIFDVYGNILVGTDYLSELFVDYDDPGMVSMVYNGDSSANDYWSGNGELSYYANKILKRSADLELLHEI